jgi:hypothetical protein
MPHQGRPASSTTTTSPIRTPPPRSGQAHPPLHARLDNQTGVGSSETEFQIQSAASPQGLSIPLPPLPPSQNGQVPHAPLPLPPLPPAAPLNNQAVQDNEPQDEGTFVANDVIDEGVKLLFRLKHTPEENISSPGGTRSRRAPIKVICLARCPHGGHFATGSDDGVCRVWRDEDDPAVNQIDCQLLPSHNAQLGDGPWNPDARSSDRKSFVA